jgi:1-aminocyclopropane-1-carboxylate deaminase/D-cysteine desulfhydrase-like pyridoxal-dependent ACC family enzyme
MNLQNSPCERLELFGKSIYLKRDDLLEGLEGNKARKFYSLATNFPQNTTKIISYGGVQSNAMLSLSKLATIKGVEFVYYVKAIPSFLEKNPHGNYYHALQNGMKLYVIGYDDFYKKIDEIKASLSDESIFIPQGGASESSKEGVHLLGYEIDSFIKSHKLKNPAIWLSSGTGTTAFFLSQLELFEVYTTPSVGDRAYLLGQIESLGSGKVPNIIETKEKIAFGKPHRALFEIYKKCLGAGVEFDLLYDCKTLLALKENLGSFESRDIIFIHSGGLYGNESMLKRYERE